MANLRFDKTVGLLLFPGVTLLLLLLVFPLLNTVAVSFKLFTPGQVGAAANAPFTIENYRQLFNHAYLHYFFQTYWLSFLATGIALIVGFPLAHIVARLPTGWKRKLLVSFLVMVMFLSALVRVYSIELTFGPVGFLRPIANFLGVNPNGGFMIELITIIGLLHYVIPMSALVLIGTIQNIDPRLAEAAEALGAPRWWAHVTVTVPLAKKGLIEAFLISYTLCISAFVIPMILGQGRLLFVTNLIFNRFSLVADYPSGAAMAVVMVLISLSLVYGVTLLSSREQKGGVA